MCSSSPTAWAATRRARSPRSWPSTPFATFLASTQGDRDLTWPYGFNPALSFNGNRLLTAVKLANRRVFQAGEEEQTYSGMGTTIVAAMIEQDSSRSAASATAACTSCKPESFDQLTHDDSWVATVLAKEPGVDESTLAQHPMRHVLTNVVGARDETEVEIGERALQSGEILLLCSDGLHGTLDDETMQQIVGGGGGCRRASPNA